MQRNAAGVTGKGDGGNGVCAGKAGGLSFDSMSDGCAPDCPERAFHLISIFILLQHRLRLTLSTVPSSRKVFW